jgi:hypothetical protein
VTLADFSQVNYKRQTWKLKEKGHANEEGTIVVAFARISMVFKVVLGGSFLTIRRLYKAAVKMKMRALMHELAVCTHWYPTNFYK